MSDIRDNYQRDYSGMDTDENDFPANTSTTGLVESGWLDYGRIYPAGDVDWFKVNLTAGVYYKFQIEAGTINGLFDPQLAIYNAGSQLLATATIGQGFQSKWVELTPTTSGSYYLAASGDSGLFGSYNLYILNGATTGSSSGTTPVTGSSANDTLVSTSGNDTFDGAGGIDTVVFAGNRASYTVSKTTNGWTVSSTAQGTDSLSNVERLSFSDTPLALDTDGNAGQVYRLYQAAFNRTPDKGGLGDWIYGMDTGMTLLQVSAGFVGSPEFQSVYGQNPTDSEVVTRFYQNVLHRNYEQAGYDYWMNQLQSGLQTRTQVLTGFSESPENQAQVIGVIQNGIEYTQHVI